MGSLQLPGHRAHDYGRLLAIIVLFNVANLSFFTIAISGPETLLAHRPTLIVSAIFAQVVATLWLVGVRVKRWGSGA